MASPHALVIPYPAQGHVIPLMELAHILVERGFKITFANTEFNHDRVVAALSKRGADLDRIRLVSMPDGLAPEGDRNDLPSLTAVLAKAMTGPVEELIKKSRETDGDKITCMVVDYNMCGWALDIARKMGVRSAPVWPASAAVLATILSIPKLIQDGIIGTDGSALSKETFQLCQDMPPMHTAHLAWNCIGNNEAQEVIFQYILDGIRAVGKSDFILCNSFCDVESPVFAYAPKILPIGPLLTGERDGKAVVGHFWSEDAACMSWLDEQPANSVVYVAFGSFTIFNQRQFQELALGLEMSGKPFLWVVRPDAIVNGGTGHAYPDGFLDRVKGRGRIVGWSPQQKVLAHASVACFMSHCGWNSTMEGVRNGVPFLTWPYFADQFVNQSYICDIWKVGLRMVADETGVITKETIASSVTELLADHGMKKRVESLKETAHKSIQEAGSSFKNLNMFVEAMKE